MAFPWVPPLATATLKPLETLHWLGDTVTRPIGHVKRVNFRSKLVQILACRGHFVPSVWTVNDV